jgi:D-alanyl-D-alanine dipeptidase
MRALIFLFLCHLALLRTASAQPKGLVEISGPDSVLDLRYNSENNFLKKNVYREFGLDRCYVHPDLASALQKLTPLLQAQKLKLILWDCYRPLAVQAAMWKLVPDPRYVGDPKQGSNHNRGVAVDVSLADATGTPLVMPTAFDDFSARAAPSYLCAAEEKQACENRDRLIQLMRSAGLNAFPTEWWHFQLPDPKRYPVLP